MRYQCLERGCIHVVFLRVGRRKTVLVISNSCSAHFLKRRSPLLLHFPTPSDPITPSQVWWSVPTLALKSPRRMSLSVPGAAEITESKSLIYFKYIVAMATKQKWPLFIKQIQWVDIHQMIITAKYASHHFSDYGETAI